jgi:hypothetical protein
VIDEFSYIKVQDVVTNRTAASAMLTAPRVTRTGTNDVAFEEAVAAAPKFRLEPLAQSESDAKIRSAVIQAEFQQRIKAKVRTELVLADQKDR